MSKETTPQLSWRQSRYGFVAFNLVSLLVAWTVLRMVLLLVFKSAAFSSGEAARILDLSPAMVRLLERNGRLPAVKTASGVRLFDVRDVRRLADERAERRRTAPSAAPTAVA